MVPTAAHLPEKQQPSAQPFSQHACPISPQAAQVFVEESQPWPGPVQLRKGSQHACPCAPQVPQDPFEHTTPSLGYEHLAPLDLQVCRSQQPPSLQVFLAQQG